jgi:type 2 lantibiotic biosynthesis protein LanM
VLCRSGYGWAKWIVPTPSQSTLPIKLFFERAGGTLALLQFLLGTDFHSENVICDGDYPVPIDCETLIQPRIKNSSIAESARLRAIIRPSDSVLSTGYLSGWLSLPNDAVAAIGGLDRIDVRTLSLLTFANINTDAMSLRLMPASKNGINNLPSLDDEELQAASYVEEIVAGYEAMYRFLMFNREVILGPTGPLSVFSNLPVRVLLRPTILYTILLNRSGSRENLSNGADSSLQFEFLARCDINTDRDSFLMLLSSERYSLIKLDIPLLASRTNSRDLFLPDGKIIKGFFYESTFERLLKKKESLNEETLSFNMSLIRQALQLTATKFHASASTPWAETQRRELSYEMALNAAREIARMLAQESIKDRGGFSWIGASPLSVEGHLGVRVVGHDLYSGAAGIGLFFAGLYRMTGDTCYRGWALAAFTPFIQETENQGDLHRFAGTIGIGGGSGLGGIIYALVRAASFINEPALLDEAVKASQFIGESEVAADCHLDVMSGAAGAILGLLALDDARPQSGALDRAMVCGHHLLTMQTDCVAGGRAWCTRNDRHLTGMSHGAAGIVLALLRLYRATPDSAIYQAAEAGVAYETHSFSKETGNWRRYAQHLTEDDQLRFSTRWCHGATGIGLARLDGLPVLDTDAIRADIDIAICRTAQEPVGPVDNLCCGNFGRLEFLLAAGQRLRRDHLINLARMRADELVETSRASGFFRSGCGPPVFNPGFFSGLSGIGYELMRLVSPTSLPSVLTLE